MFYILQGFHDAWSGWLVVFAVGALTGFAAGVIDIGAEWMTDIKEGICTEQFWFNKKACCWTSSSKFGLEQGCPQWKTWSDVVGLAQESYLLNYFFYVLFAFIFALMTVVLVMFFAPYACGSGIPEVRNCSVFNQCMNALWTVNPTLFTFMPALEHSSSHVEGFDTNFII